MELMRAPQAFLGLDEADACSYEEAKVVVIPFGLETSVSYGKGTAQGPDAIIEASHQLELFDEEFWCEPFRKMGIVTLKAPKILNNQIEALKQLEAIISRIINDGKFPLLLGGEHTITVAAIRSYLKHHDNLAIVHFDAHADLRDEYQGVRYSHACAMRRCLDFNPVRLTSIGIRNISAEEIPFLQANQHRINIFWAKDKKDWDIQQILSTLRDYPIYLSFDVDGFDASLMPATGTPEPGGLFWEETIDIIRQVSQACHIVGCDINELSPIASMHSCDFLTAKLAYKILSFIYLKGYCSRFQVPD